MLQGPFAVDSVSHLDPDVENDGSSFSRIAAQNQIGICCNRHRDSVKGMVYAKHDGCSGMNSAISPLIINGRRPSINLSCVADLLFLPISRETEREIPKLLNIVFS